MLLGLTSALRGLATNKLRSFLTMLGVIFGVAAVIVAVALGQGSRDASLRRFQKLGTTTLSVFPGRNSKGGISFGQKSTLKLKDAEAILRVCASVRRVSPTKQGVLQVKYGNRNADPQVIGTGPDMPIIRKFDFKQGRYFTASDYKSGSLVCVLGWQAYKDLFESGPCIGANIYIKGARYKVLGLFTERGGTGFQNDDNAVYVPCTTALKKLFGGAGEDVLSGIVLQGRSEALMAKAQEEAGDVLRQRHKIGQGKANDFLIFNVATAAATSSEQADDFEQLINCLAAVALIVGGIGIMNIMLVSVTERTREIGIRKAIGAKRRNIMAQFLLEALFLSLVGGVIGVAFGIWFTIYGLPKLKPDWETALTIMPTIIAFGFSAVVGIFFGFYPALKASKLNPIEALRYE